MKFELFVHTSLRKNFTIFLLICCTKKPFPPKISISIDSNISKDVYLKVESLLFTTSHCISDHMRGFKSRTQQHTQYNLLNSYPDSLLES